MQFLRVASNDGGSLVIEREDKPAPLWWRAKIEAPGLSAAADIDADAAQFGNPIDKYFASLAADWRGWSEAKTWNSLDHTLRFSATHDGLGHVELRVELSRSVYHDAWQASATLKLDAGGLEAIARDAARFLTT
jgi:hypothetical protein